MKTYRINKYAERLAQGTGFAPELIYNISLVRFQGRNGRCIAAWTPGMKRPPPVCLQGPHIIGKTKCDEIKNETRPMRRKT